jgi:hypothetical protein
MKLIYFTKPYLFLNLNPELDTFHGSEEVQIFVWEWFWECKGLIIKATKFFKLFLSWTNASILWGDYIEN